MTRGTSEAQLKEFLLAISACAVGLSLLLTRSALSETDNYWFYVWNIFLSFIPWYLAVQLDKQKNSLQAALTVAAWVLFLPNAFYVATDAVHLAYIQTALTDTATSFSNDPDLWRVMLDTVIVMLATWVSWMLGILSLLKVHKYFKPKLKLYEHIVGVNIVILASGFAIYLGRFIRFNSWDVISAPGFLASEIFNIALHPVDNWQAYFITLIYFLLISVVYWSVYILRSAR